MLFPHAGAEPEIFQGRRSFVEKHTRKAHERKALLGKTLGFFLQEPVKTIFRMKNLTQRWRQSGPFFIKIKALFSIF